MLYLRRSYNINLFKYQIIDTREIPIPIDIRFTLSVIYCCRLDDYKLGHNKGCPSADTTMPHCVQTTA